MIGDISVEEFEQWVYNSANLQSELGEESYMALIEFNYNTPGAKYELFYLLENTIGASTYFKHVLLRLIVNLEKEDYKDFPAALMECYDLYCHGCEFLHALALGFGLHILCPPSEYDVEDWYDLTETQQKELIDKLELAEIREEVRLLKKWVINDEVEITSKSSDNYLSVIDNRST